MAVSSRHHASSMRTAASRSDTAVVCRVVAGAMTFGIGKAAQAYYRSGLTLSMEKLQEVFHKGAEEYRRLKSLKADRSQA